MKKYVKWPLVLSLSLLLFGCGDSTTMEEAENIAIEKAKSEGYENPTVWNRFDSETQAVHQYSKTHNEDVESWQVYIDTANNPKIKNTPALVYYVSVENGEIIDAIKGIPQP